MIRSYTRWDPWGRGCQTHTRWWQSELDGGLCSLQPCVKCGPKAVNPLQRVQTASDRNIWISALWARFQRGGLTWWCLSHSLLGSAVLLTGFGPCDLAPLPMLLRRLGFFLQLYAPALCCCTKELFVCLLSASPPEISCDGKLWGSFLPDEMLRGADNGAARARRPQQLRCRRRRRPALPAGGGRAAGRVGHCREWCGAIGQGSRSLKNPPLLSAGNAFTEVGHCSSVWLNSGPSKLWVNFY